MSKASVYPLAEQSICLLSEERGSKNWTEQMHNKIEKNEAKNAKKPDKNIEKWLTWAAASLHLLSREEVGAEEEAGAGAKVGGNSNKTKRMKTMTRKTMRRKTTYYKK